MKINARKLYVFVGFLLYCGVALFSAQLDSILGHAIIYALPIVMFLCFLAASNGKIIVSVPPYYAVWVTFCVFAMAGSFLLRFDYLYATLCILLCVASASVLAGSTAWLAVCKKILLFFTGLHVFFTFFFWLFPQAYSVMVDFYGYIPVGTSNGTAGYRAGIAAHFSNNGIYISVLLMLLIVLFYIKDYSARKQKQRKIAIIVGIVLTFLALLLTAKRGVLIWSIAALVLTYLVVSPQKLRSVIKVGTIVVLGIGFLVAMTDSTSDFAYVFNRFTLMGKDLASRERLAMWQLALNAFLENPILGNGFWSFRYLYCEEMFGIFQTDVRFQFLDAHNVYFQVLCETGIIGFVVYSLAVGLMLYYTIKLVKKLRYDRNEDVRFGAVFSLCLQFFYLLYSLSGNCLYDNVFYFYGLAMAMTTSLNYYVKHRTDGHGTMPDKGCQI